MRRTLIDVRSVLWMSLIVLACTRSEVPPPGDSPPGEWRVYGADRANTKYSPLDQINRDNVDQLAIAWTWQAPSGDVSIAPNLLQWIFEATPIMVDGVLYSSTTVSQVAAIDAATGELLWVFDPATYTSGTTAHDLFIHRGVTYWEDGDDARIYYGTNNGYLIALDAKTGTPVPSFGQDGWVDLTAESRRPVDRDEFSVTSPPIVVRDVIVVGSGITDAMPQSGRPTGDVRAYDVRTGEMRWTFHTIPNDDEFGADTWENGSNLTTGNANVWTMMAADEELGYVYLPTSTPTNDWYGGHRLGDNLFAESLVAVDVTTGERVWHFQAVHHGLWDYDFPAGPNLIDVTVDGRQITAVAQVSKQGFVYVFDRATGEPVWPIEERPVPPSTMPGEQASPTQPFPTWPPPFERQGLTEDDLIDFTPELHAEAQRILAGVGHGPLFTPPSPGPFAYLPGALGGANWHGAAFDPETQRLYVPSITLAGALHLVEPPPDSSDHRYVHEVIGWLWGADGLPIVKPPYGRITAYDMNTGEIDWVTPMGDGPRNHPALAGLDLPRLGWPMRAAPLLTKTLLFAGQEARAWHHIFTVISGQATTEDVDELTNFEPSFAAYDKGTGDLLFELELPANVTGAPMTYLANGKQYIVFPIGGILQPARLIALSLPN